MVEKWIKPAARALLLALVVTAPAAAQGEYDRIARMRAANAGVQGLKPMADGEHYTVPARGRHDIVRCAYASHRDTMLLYRSEFPVGEYEFSADGSVLLLSDAGTVEPIYRRSHKATYTLARRIADGTYVTSAAAFVRGRDASLSPDGRWVCYSSDNDLYLWSVADGSTRRLTADGCWNKIINGTSDWVYEEEYGFTRAYAFSPDGRQIAYLRFDESAVPTFEMMRFDGRLYNRAYSFKYPKAGDNNSAVGLWLCDTATGSSRCIEECTSDDGYLFNPCWTPAGELYFYRVNRLQNRFETVLVRADGTLSTIYAEQSPRYVERPSAGTVTFVDAKRFVVCEESTSGWRHLYLHSVDKGRIRPLTQGRWEVVSTVSVGRDRVCYISTERSPLRRELSWVSLDGRRRGRLGCGEGFRTIYPSAGMKYYVQVFSNALTPNIVTIHRGDGSVVDTLSDSRSAVAAAGMLPQREFRRFATERGDTLYYYIQLPSRFDASKRYPLLITQYSGPGSQQVADRWWADWEDALAEQGYIVACCDGRGTGFRGEAFKKCTYGALGRLETEDQLAFARMLAAQPWVDGERIGIYGWSFGGFMALNCALRGEGLFRMAIAVAPVTSWRYYDTIYTEIYNGLPQDNPAGYDDCSPLSCAERLSPATRLLIIHGTADDNVHFQNTAEMCRRLNAAGKQYDVMIYPDQNHSMRPSCTHLVRQKMIDYTLENL